MKVLLKKAFLKVISNLNSDIQDEMLRSRIEIPEQINDSLKFKIVETKEELEASFRLVYRHYLPKGYCSMNKYEMRATIYHALPTTTTLVAKEGEKVVGTLTMVRDNRLGLPSEKVFDYSHLRMQSHRLAEITSLVIDREYRRKNGGHIFFPLLKLMYEYSTYYFGVNHLLVTILPKDIAFYKSILLFKEHKTSDVKDYLGAPAISLHLDLQNALYEYEKVYSHKKAKNNLFDFFVLRKIPNLEFPERKYNTINDPLVDLKYYKELFVNKLQVEYLHNERRKIENILSNNDVHRQSPRVEVEIPAKVNVNLKYEQKTLHFRLKDVSRNGFRAFTNEAFNLCSEMKFDMNLGFNKVSQVKARVIWLSPDHGIGFEILHADQEWHQFIDYLYRNQFSETA